MTTYHARAERGERYWLVHVPEVNRTTQARHLREVVAMAADLVAVMRDVDPDSIDIAVDIDLPANVQTHLADAERFRREAARCNAEAAHAIRAAARDLADSGMPLRDIGVALGVSHQRAHQLVAADAAEPTPAT